MLTGDLSFYPTPVMNKTTLQALSHQESSYASYPVFDSLRYETLYHRGQALLGAKRYQSALFAFNRAIFLRPDRPEAWLWRAMVLVPLKRYGEALSCCDRAMAAQADRALIWAMRGVIYHQQGQYKASYESYAKVSETSSSSWWQRLQHHVQHYIQCRLQTPWQRWTRKAEVETAEYSKTVGV